MRKFGQGVWRGMLVALLISGMSSAVAGPWFAREGGRQDFQQGRREAQEQRQRRDESRDEQRPRRLSQEERSQLRRDIREAGREIYPQRR